MVLHVSEKLTLHVITVVLCPRDQRQQY
uniref:Uncharacterized protein n=1 Tax=Arundo donax TaxID=35708 RepID=A0A0A8YN30_ARUDO